MRQFACHALAVLVTLALLPLAPQAVAPVAADSLVKLVDDVVAAEPLRPRLGQQATLQIVAQRMDVELDPRIPTPAIRFESVTSLEQFQDAVERQWGFRPERFVNAFVAHTNQIYLIDDRAYYVAVGGTLDESLAHELVHYVQSRYGRANLYEWAECEAVAIQKWFRAEHLDSHAGLFARAPD